MLLGVITGVVARLLGMKSRWTGIFRMLEPGFGDSIVADVRCLRTKAETMRNALLEPRNHYHIRRHHPRSGGGVESERLIRTVEAHEVTVDSIIVNHVMAECDCDFFRCRAASQKGYIEETRAKFGDKHIAHLHSCGEGVKARGSARWRGTYK